MDFCNIHVKSVDELWSIIKKEILYNLFDDCFGNNLFDHTYGGEDVDIENVISAFEEFANDGILVLCRNQESSSIVGFSAALPLKKQPDVWNASQNYLADALHYWYHSELGVSQNYRRKGLANLMTSSQITMIPSNRIIVRARIDNIATIKLHEKHGFTLLRDAQEQDVKQWVPVKRKATGKIMADERVFLTLHKK